MNDVPPNWRSRPGSSRGKATGHSSVSSGLTARMRRRIGNLRDRLDYAQHIELHDLAHTIFTHQTPLSRPLPGFATPDVSRKATNLQRVSGLIDGLLIGPGQAFSFWQLVGRPSRQRGFVPALGPIDGVPTVHLGGGLCQATNLLFWMIAHSPLRVLERWRHAYDVAPDTARTQPFGSGATVVFNHRDLRVQNQTAHTYQIRIWVSPTHLHGALNADAPLPAPICVAESHGAILRHGGAGGAEHFSRQNKLWRVQGPQRTLLVENKAKVLYQPDPAQITEPPPSDP